MDSTKGIPVSQWVSQYETLSRNDGRYSEVETFAGAALPSAFGGANTNSTGVVKSFSDANASTVEDQAGKKRRSMTNALGQLIRVDEPNNAGELGTIASPNQPTSYTYDTLNNLMTVTQGVQTRTFTYNSLSRLLTATNPESGTISYQYDDNGNLTSKLDARSITTSYVYDALNRVTQRNYSDSTPNVGYTYKTSAPAIGSLIKVESSVSTTEYTGFDILGRVTGHKQTTDGEEYDTEYVYNLSGGLVEQIYPSGRKVKNVTDQNGYLSMVQSRKDLDHGYWNYAQNLTYNAVGALTSMQLGNGRWESTKFNSRLQPIQIALGATNGATNFLKLDYNYGTGNNNGNVQSQTITVPTVGITPGFAAVQNYTYDSLNRIKTAEETVSSVQTWQQAFLYDRYGNRNFDEDETTTLPKSCMDGSNPIVCEADRKIFNPTANASNNRLSSSDDYVFDSVGNTINDPQSRTFIYNADNKQVEVKNNLNLTIGKYWYDGNGKRIKKHVPATGEITVFVYDAAGKLIADYSTEVAPDPKVSYTTTDHLGSPRILTDENGEIISRRDFHSFGEEIATVERTAALGYQIDDIRQKFTTYERDSETELDFAQARYFNSGFGRFSSPDAPFVDQHLQIPQSWNLYVYVRNNPVIFMDPTGRIVDYGGNDKIKRRVEAIAEKSKSFAKELKELDNSSNVIVFFVERGLRKNDEGSNADAQVSKLKDGDEVHVVIYVDSARTPDKQIIHEVGHGQDVRTNEDQFFKDAKKTERTKNSSTAPPHDERPEERRANKFKDQVIKEVREYEKEKRKEKKKKKDQGEQPIELQ